MQCPILECGYRSHTHPGREAAQEKGRDMLMHRKQALNISGHMCFPEH